MEDVFQQCGSTGAAGGAGGKSGHWGGDNCDNCFSLLSGLFYQMSSLSGGIFIFCKAEVETPTETT